MQDKGEGLDAVHNELRDGDQIPAGYGVDSPLLHSVRALQRRMYQRGGYATLRRRTRE